MTQPTFVPVADSGAVRPSAPTPSAELGRVKKIGLLGAPAQVVGQFEGSPGPDAGYALTLAHHAVEGLSLGPGVAHHDVELGVALLASKRASLSGRGPTLSDVEVALDLFGWRSAVDGSVETDRRGRFAGLGHSYVAQRRFVDAVPLWALSLTPGTVKPLLQMENSREARWRTHV